MRDSENRFDALLDQTAVGVVLSAPDGRWRRVNQKLCDILGYDEGELMSLGFRPITHSEDVDSDRDLLARLKAGEIPEFTEEKRFIHKDGSIAWVFITVSLVRNAEGDPDCFITIIENIWRRARIQEELRRSEERFRDIASNVPGVVYQFRLDTQGQWSFPYVSPTLFEITGLRPEDVMADASLWMDTIHPDDSARFEASVERSAQSLEPWAWEGRMFRASGELWWVRCASMPQRLDDGSVLWNGLVVDITKQKLAEVELRESEERYRELFDESPVAIWEEDWTALKQMLDELARQGVKDWRGYFDSHRDQLKRAYDSAKIIEISRAAIDLYRAESKEELARMTRAAVVIDEELDAFRETVLSVLAGRMTVDIEAKDMAGDGSEIIVRRRMVMPPKYRDNWSRVIYAMEDITEPTRIEEQLRQAQKMEAVGQLTGGVAHDFNNLLAIIMGNAELLSIEAKETSPKIEAVIRAATRGAELTKRLLAFSRKQTLQPQSVELNVLVGGMTDLLGRTLGETIEIKVSSARGLWRANVDPGQLEIALLNLAINARDAMSGGGTLMIESSNANLDEAYARNQSDVTPGEYVMLAVSDNGSGMSSEVREHALEPFFTTKEVGEGSGLGLSMVYGFAKQTGGHVAIYSEEGQGTTVKLYLPRAGADAARTSAETAKEAPRARGETVLVVEDNADVRQLAVGLLEELGYQVLQAPDGWAALSDLKESAPPDLLLSDVVLPRGFSGPGLAEKIKRELPAIKILFMSGYAEYATRHNGLAGNGAEVLNKPFRKQELALKVREVLDR